IPARPADRAPTGCPLAIPATRLDPCSPFSPRETAMGLLIDGRWVDQWYDTSATGGRFVRSDAQFRGAITPDGGPGPDGREGFRAEAGRYRLYVSLACPWAHRT